MGKVKVTWTTAEYHSAVIDAGEWDAIPEEDRADYLAEMEADESWFGSDTSDIEVEDVDDDE